MRITGASREVGLPSPQRCSVSSKPETLVAVDAKFVDEALYTLATLLRSMGHHSFPMEGDDREAFAYACEQWARHLLSGSASPSTLDEPGPVPDDARAWASLRRFFRHRRALESEWVRGRLKESSGVVRQIERGMRATIRHNRRTADDVDKALQGLELIAPTGAEEIQASIRRAAAEIRNALQAQQQHLDREAQALDAVAASMCGDPTTTTADALLDPLTSLQSRQRFEEALPRFVDLASVTHKPLSLVFLNLDEFHPLNSRHGHPWGDQVLVQIANAILRSYPRRHDFVARYDGDEFVAILFDTPGPDSARVTHALLRRIRKLEFPGLDEPVTCSAGLAVLGADEGATTLVARCHAALASAKRQGRDQLREAPTSE
jgi:diguanylate cyclase (GGDEF)-like protein